MKHYDYDCYYLVAVPKSVSDSIPENEGEMIGNYIPVVQDRSDKKP